MAYANLCTHFIWSTKDRRPLIHADLQSDLYSYIGGILRKRKHVLLAAGGVEDHVHLLIGMHQTQSIADCVRDVKSNSSSWVHENYSRLKDFSWQTKYGAFSVSQSSVKDVTRYIENQHEHHKTISFQEEFVLLLKKHNIKFDTRFVFE